MGEESDGTFGDMIKQMSMSKSFPMKKIFCVILKEAVSKIEIPKDFEKLDVVIGSTEYRFSVNYGNYFSSLIKPLKECCSFNFYYKFVKKKQKKAYSTIHCKSQMCNE